jgi:hypothetical protein
MSENPIHELAPADTPTALVKARAVAELCADYCAEQMGDSGVPWNQMNPMNQRGLVMTALTYMGMEHALNEFEESQQ